MIGAAVASLLSLQPAIPVRHFLPGPGDVRFQAIRRVKGERDWPFIADEGRLACVMSMGHPVVMFLPSADGEKHRPFLLDYNLYNMMFINIGITDVLRPYDKPEELAERLAGFVTQGQMLCKYNDGPVVPGSEL